MNYDDMPAGDEMDRLVAEKVMGWTQIVVPKPKGGTGIAWVSPDMADERVKFRPSVSIDHAWEVREKLKAIGKLMIIFPFDGKECCALAGGHDHDFIPHMGNWIDCSLDGAVYGQTVPEAICRMALKAVGK